MYTSDASGQNKRWSEYWGTVSPAVELQAWCVNERIAGFALKADDGLVLIYGGQVQNHSTQWTPLGGSIVGWGFNPILNGKDWLGYDAVSDIDYLSFVVDECLPKYLYMNAIRVDLEQELEVVFYWQQDV